MALREPDHLAEKLLVDLAENVGTLSRVAGILSAVLGVALTIYGIWFVMRKSRKLIT